MLTAFIVQTLFNSIDDKEQDNKGTNDIKVIVVVRTPTSYTVKS